MELFGKGINYSSYEERKALIKKKVRERIKNNPSFDSFLEEHRAKGKFIKNTTEDLLKCSFLDNYYLKIEGMIDCKLNNSNPIVSAFYWEKTNQGRHYWNSLNNKFIEKIRKNY